MRWTHKHTGIGMLAIAAALLAIAAMNPDNTRPTTSISTEPSSGHSTSDATSTSPVSRPVITLGNLDLRYIPRPP